MLAAVRRGQRLDRALAAVRHGPERASVRRLAEGTVRLRARLDTVLAARVPRGLASVEPRLLDVLRLATYELLEEPETPDYAAVSDAVDAAQGLLGAGPAGFTNAVLRNVAKTGLDMGLFPDPESDPLGHLASFGSHPRWLLDRWAAQFGMANTSRIVALNNHPAPLYLRPVGMTLEQTETVLAEMGIAVARSHPSLPSLRLPPVNDLTALLDRTASIIQDPAATAVTEFLDLAGLPALDLCAAPGGKSVGLWQAGATWVLAADRSAARLRRVRESADRLEAPLSCVVADAARPPFAPAPVVLLDAPCSGTGTLRRNPDARWRLTAEGLAGLSDVQARLLDGAASATAAGGLLVYSTCSLEPEENGLQVERFLARRPDFSLEPEEGLPTGFRDPAGSLQVLPHTSGFDGSYAARLRRA